MKAILKTKALTFGDMVINIRELSALQYLDQQEYMAGLVTPDDASENATQEELNILSRAWNRLTLQGQSRLIAYSLSSPGDDIDELQYEIQNSYSFDVIKQLHDEIAVISGFVLSSPDDQDDDSELESEGVDAEAEPSPN